MENEFNSSMIYLVVLMSLNFQHFKLDSFAFIDGNGEDKLNKINYLVS